MNAFKPGDRVHVEFDGEVVASTFNDTVWTTVHRDLASGNSRVKVTDCTIIRPPLRVGDVITAPRDPEPPVGTVIRAKYGGLFERVGGGYWQMAGHPMHFTWDEFDFDAGKILHLPDADQ